MQPAGFVPSTAVSSPWRASPFVGKRPACATFRRLAPAVPTVAAPLRRLRFPQMQLGSPAIQVGRPKTSIKKNTGLINETQAAPEADTGKGAAKARPRRKTQADEIPLYKVILLGDEEYVEAHVTTQLQKTVQIDKQEASRIFGEAQSTGSAVVCVVCEEHAEFYAQQLKRQEIFVTVEKDE